MKGDSPQKLEVVGEVGEGGEFEEGLAGGGWVYGLVFEDPGIGMR